MLLNLDLAKERINTLKYKQNDTRTVTLNIYNNDVAFDLTGYTVVLNAINEKGEGFTQSTNITISNNKATVKLNKDFTRVPGEVKVEVVISHGDYQVTTFTFSIMVKAGVLQGAKNLLNGVAQDVIEALGLKIVEATKVLNDTESLITNGGATTKGELKIVSDEVNLIKTTKVDKVTGKELSTNDFTNNYKFILDNFLNKTYPVGSIYMSMNSANPSTLFGGSWSAISQGRVLVGVDTTQTEFNVVKKTGGNKTHTLTINEIPSHNHTERQYNLQAYHKGTIAEGYIVTGYDDVNTGNTGGGQSHNNLQPFLTCYIWERIS